MPSGVLHSQPVGVGVGLLGHGLPPAFTVLRVGPERTRQRDLGEIGHLPGGGVIAAPPVRRGSGAEARARPCRRRCCHRPPGTGVRIGSPAATITRGRPRGRAASSTAARTVIGAGVGAAQQTTATGPVLPVAAYGPAGSRAPAARRRSAADRQRSRQAPAGRRPARRARRWPRVGVPTAPASPSAASRSPAVYVSARSRSSSCHCDQRIRGRPPEACRCSPPAGRSEQRLTDQRELADAGDRLTAVGPARPAGPSRLAAIRSATIPRRSAARRPPDRSISWNHGPGALRQRLGEVLDVPGPSRRVDDPGDVGLLDQHRVDVAGDPQGQRVRPPERGVEGPHRDGVGAADTGGEAGQGARGGCCSTGPGGSASATS